jgi:hypothetical protein
MTTISFQRQKLTTTDTFSVSVGINSPVEVGVNTYIPITIDEFPALDKTIPTVQLGTGAASTFIKALTPGAFDKVKVGDIIKSTAAGLITPLATTTLTALVTAVGSKIAIFPSSFTSLTLPVKAGDKIASANLPANTVVDKIDYVKKLIYLTNNALTSGSLDATVTAPVRVTAVRGSTWPVALDANQIDFDSVNTVTAASTSVTIGSGIREALMGVIKVATVGSTTNGVVSIQVGGYKNAGKDVSASNDGTGSNSYATYNYSSLGSLTLNADEFLLDAGVPRDTVYTPGSGS